MPEENYADGFVKKNLRGVASRLSKLPKHNPKRIGSVLHRNLNGQYFTSTAFHVGYCLSHLAGLNIS